MGTVLKSIMIVLYELKYNCSLYIVYATYTLLKLILTLNKDILKDDGAVCWFLLVRLLYNFVGKV